MSKNEYSRSLTTGVIAHVEGESLVIDGPTHLVGGALVIDAVNFLPQDVDYTDSDSVRVLATSAVHAYYAIDGFFEQNVRGNHACNSAKETFTVKGKTHFLDIFTVQFCFYWNFKLVTTVYLCPSGKSGANIICAILITLGNQVILIP